MAVPHALSHEVSAYIYIYILILIFRDKEASVAELMKFHNWSL